MLSVEAGDGYAVVTLERPEKRNALSIELRFELADALDRLAADEEIGCAVLTGAGRADAASARAGGRHRRLAGHGGRDEAPHPARRRAHLDAAPRGRDAGAAAGAPGLVLCLQAKRISARLGRWATGAGPHSGA